MTTSNDENQKSCTERTEPQRKGGVAGTDSKDFNPGDPFGKNPKPEKEPAKSKTD